MTEDEFDAEASKAIRLIREAPEAAIKRIVALMDQMPQKSASDFYVTCRKPGTLVDHERAAAAEKAITRTWGSLAGLAAEKGYNSLPEIATALGEALVTVRQMKRTGFVGHHIMIRMSLEPENPAPAKIRITTLASLIERFKTNPKLWVHFRQIALAKCRANDRQVRPRPIVNEIRIIHKEEIGDEMATFFTSLFCYAYPEFNQRFERPPEAVPKQWEADLTEELARELLEAAPKPRGRPRKIRPEGETD